MNKNYRLKYIKDGELKAAKKLYFDVDKKIHNKVFCVIGQDDREAKKTYSSTEVVEIYEEVRKTFCEYIAKLVE